MPFARKMRRGLLAACLALLLQTALPSAGHAGTGLFGTRETRHGDIAAFEKWTAALRRFDRQMETDPSSPGAAQWQSLLRRLKDAPPRAQIEGVNGFFNRLPYVEDSENYGADEYWATPLEFLGRGSGDCEDFAIAKYAALRALGFSPQHLRVAVVMDEIKRTPHAVLIVYAGDGDFVLDNQDRKVEPVSAVGRYRPIFSLGSDSWWEHRT